MEWSEEHIGIIQGEAASLAAERGVVDAHALVDAVREAFNANSLPYDTFRAEDLAAHIPEGVAVEGLDEHRLHPA